MSMSPCLCVCDGYLSICFFLLFFFMNFLCNTSLSIFEDEECGRRKSPEKNPHVQVVS